MGSDDSGDRPAPYDGAAPRREPGSVLVVRAWRTGSGPDDFRARVIRVGDLPHGAARSTVTGDPDELCALVRAWIAEVGR